MRASPEEVVNFCEEHGIDVRHTWDKFQFRYCPSCESQKWKVSLFDTSLRGKCFKCDEIFHIRRYLLEMGLDKGDISKIFGLNKYKQQDDGTILLSQLVTLENTHKGIESNHDVDISKFFRISDWLDHTASKYAIKRGVVPELYEHILIDNDTFSVCFLSTDFYTGKVNGYQLRYVNPQGHAKTWNLPGFKTADNILIYENKGKPVVVCEGPFNAVSAYRYGFTGISTYGANFSERQVKMIKEYVLENDVPVYSGFDMDSAGLKAHFRFKDYLDFYGIEVKKIEPEVGNDLNDSLVESKGYVLTDGPIGSMFSMVDKLID